MCLDSAVLRYLREASREEVHPLTSKDECEELIRSVMNRCYLTKYLAVMIL